MTEVLRVETLGAAVRFSVHVQPRATRTEIVGQHGAALKVRVHALPVDGAANTAVVDLLADRLGVPRRNVRVVVGMTSRAKVVEIHGVTERDVRQLLAQVS